jgi:hypothetical protein
MENLFKSVLEESLNDEPKPFSKMSPEKTRLLEQLYGKKSRILYHASYNDFNLEDIKPSVSIYTNFANATLKDFPGLIFLTPSIDFAIEFLKIINQEKDKAWLYSYRLSDKIDLFNYASEYDRKNVMFHVKTENEKEKVQDEFSRLSKEENPRYWKTAERFAFVKLLYKFGYDGITTFAGGIDNQTENIALFDNAHLIPVKKIEINPYRIKYTSEELFDLVKKMSKRYSHIDFNKRFLNIKEILLSKGYKEKDINTSIKKYLDKDI